MAGTASNLPHLVFAAALLAGVSLAREAKGEVLVSVQVDSEARRPLAERVVSELESEGYAVKLDESGASPCETSGAQVVPVGRETRAWVRLTQSPAGDDTVVASICYLGALPFLQQAASSAPSSDPQKLAVATAEALNGLRSKLPPVVGESAVAVRRAEARPSPAPEPARSGVVNRVAFRAALLVELPDYPAAPGAMFGATLGLGTHAGLMLDALVPVGGAELESSALTATVRTAWLRLGPRLDWALGDFELSGALLAGPAITWATAVARAPRAGTADVSPGVVLSVAALAEYPRRAKVFACASTSASALLPGSRVDLADGRPAPRGSFPLEASLGLGARWESEP